MTDAQPYDPAKYAFHVSIGHEFSFPSPAPGEVPYAKLTVPENKRFVMEYVNITGLGPGGAETIMFCALHTVVADFGLLYFSTYQLCYDTAMADTAEFQSTSPYLC